MRCPDRQSCIDGTCVLDPSDGGVTERCGTLSGLRDDFDDGVTSPLWNVWNDPGVTTSEIDGHVLIDVPAGTATGWGGYTSRHYYNLRGGVIDAQVIQVGGQYTNLEVRSPDGVAAQLIVENGKLIATIYGIADDGIRASIDYDPTLHRFWRFREDGGRLYWEHSSDRATWNLLYDEALPFPAEHVRGIVSGGGQLASATQIRYDDVNLATVDPGRCAIATFTDGFDDGAIEPVWDSWEDVGCTLSETGGFLRIQLSGNDPAWCGVESMHLFDARDSSVVVEVPMLPTIAGYVTYIQVHQLGPDQTYLEMSRDGGFLQMEQRIAGDATSMLRRAFDSTAHRFWRIRNAGDMVYFDTAPDGGAWTNQLEATAQVDLSSVTIVVAGGQYGPGPIDAATIDFAAVNP